MIWLTTFSDHSMNISRAKCIASGLQHGVEAIAGPHLWEPSLETRDGFTFEWLKGQPLFTQFDGAFWASRGCGYFIWKPYIIDVVMSKVPDGDFIVYADAGVEFIDNIRYIIDRMNQDVFLFGNNWEHAHWCKRDVVEAIFSRMTLPEYTHWTLPVEWGVFGKQAQASVIVLRVSKWSRKFVAEWLEWCVSGARLGAALTFGRDNAERREDRAEWSVTWSKFRPLIGDAPSVFPNHPEFREHRHDQAILTTLAYREGIKLHYWPAQYNDGAFVYEKQPEYAGDNYPILFHHHRRRNHEWEAVA